VFEIRLTPGMPYKYMRLGKPSMEVTHEWRPLAEVSKEVEGRVSLGHFEIVERGGYVPAPYTEFARMPEPVPDFVPEKPIKVTHAAQKVTQKGKKKGK
jgi:hypothetical protein